MLSKSLIVGGAALLAAATLQPHEAAADSYLDYDYQTTGYGDSPDYDGYPGYDPYPGYPSYPGSYPSHPGYDDDYDDDDYYRRISCRQGKRIVRSRGFYAVQAVSCGGNIYRYRAVRHHRNWRIRVSARSGRIISARPVGGYGYY